MARLAFFGLGQMGTPMAGRLLDAGHDVTVWNRTPSKANRLVERGARRAETPEEAARDAEALITMLATSEAVEEVLFGSDGAASTMAPGSTLIEMSTVGPDAVRQLAARLPGDASILDARVLGA